MIFEQQFFGHLVQNQIYMTSPHFSQTSVLTSSTCFALNNMRMPLNSESLSCSAQKCLESHIPFDNKSQWLNLLWYKTLHINQRESASYLWLWDWKEKVLNSDSQSCSRVKENLMCECGNTGLLVNPVRKWTFPDSGPSAAELWVLRSGKQ